MGYLIGSILLSVVGVFLGGSSYLLEDNALAYAFGTVASVSFLIGFLLLEYALFHYRYQFGSVFAAWEAGVAAILSLFGVYFWGESISMLKAVFIIIALLGVSGLIFGGSKSYT